jgi:hypothetical protein
MSKHCFAKYQYGYKKYAEFKDDSNLLNQIFWCVSFDTFFDLKEIVFGYLALFANLESKLARN